MKKLRMKAVASFTIFVAGSLAMAFGTGEYFYGSALLVAKKSCPDLKIQKGDFLEVAAEQNSFGLSLNRAGNLTSLLQFSVPAQGNYVFDTSVDFPLTNEFRNGEYDIQKDSKSGDITILRTSAETTQCLLTNCPGFGVCSADE